MTDLSTALLHWFDQHGRHDLPWKKRPTPYRVWVSEVMLQQTQVATVIPYFQRFIKRFPTVTALAQAPIDEVLLHWSGLGYYARARHLHQAAQFIAFQCHGRFPKTMEALLELPGIGRSTAGAVLSFGMNIPAVILDGNVKRVLSRYHAIKEPINKHSTLNHLWDLATQHTPQKKIKEYNQGIMDIGALICTRRKPNCPICPLHKKCEAHALGSPEQFPVSLKRQSKRPQKVTYMLLLLSPEGEVLLEKRPPTGIWPNLWSFPECTDLEAIPNYVQTKLDTAYKNKMSWEPLQHQFSHFALTIHPVLICLSDKPIDIMDTLSGVWYSAGDSLPGGIPAPVTYLLKKLTKK